MKKLVVFMLCILSLCLANDAPYVITRMGQSKMYNITNDGYTKLCRTVVTFVKKNQFYMADQRKEKLKSFYYACDGFGRRKINLDLVFDDQWKTVQTSWNITVEGDLPQAEAETLATELVASMNALFAQ